MAGTKKPHGLSGAGFRCKGGSETPAGRLTLISKSCQEKQAGYIGLT